MPRAVPLYLNVARELRQGIASGRHPVGELLPTEAELATSFGVSRQTVRQAIGHLRRMHLLSARKGVGTRVESAEPRAAFYHALQSLTDVFQYAHHTVFRVDAVERVRARGKRAAELNCRPGQEWLHLAGVREAPVPAPTCDPGQAAPICRLDVWIDARYAAVAETERAHREAIFSKIEARFGVPVVEVRQDLEAVLLDESAAVALDAHAGGPALRIVRRYIGPGGKTVELSDSLHPAERFRYSMRLRRED